ncbi:hypothetical protein BDQ17DRAFT_1328001 [Cyathus striatus]|nr:hypothetical protein BDQ17DRAFT_1328001 [Cyathus striatus]
MSKSISTSNSVNPSMVEPRSSRSSTRVGSVAPKTQEISEGGTNTPSELSEMPKTVRSSSRVASRAQVQSGGGTITPSEPSEMPKAVRSSSRVASRAQVQSGGGTITSSEPSEKPKSMRSSTRIAANKAQEQSGVKDTPHEPTNMSKLTQNPKKEKTQDLHLKRRKEKGGGKPKAEQILENDNTSVAPPPLPPQHQVSSPAKTTSTSATAEKVGNSLNEEEILVPLSSQLGSLNIDKFKTTSESSSDTESSNTSESNKQLNELNAFATVDESEEMDKSEEMDESEEVGESEEMNEFKGIDELQNRSESEEIKSHSSVRSYSDSDPQGASCAVGGFSHQHAIGNFFNFGDKEEDVSMDLSMIPPENTNGEIHLFLTHDHTKADYVIDNQTPGSDLASVLEIIAEYWELVSDKNSPISVHKDERWMLKGRFSKALQRSETLDWKQKNNKYIVEILADGAVDQQIPGPSSTVNKSSSSKSKSESGMSNSDIIQLLINHFEIPKHLQNVDKKKDSIKMTYLKYCKINEILSKEMELATLGEIAHCHIHRKLIIAVFMASSTYYQYPFKIFPMLSYDPAMESWFEEDEPDKDYTKAVWEGLKPNFSNLQKLLEGKKAAMDYRAKQKEREESEKEKEKSKKSHHKGKSKKL